MAYQLFLIATGAPMQHPMSYRIGIAAFWMLGFVCYIIIQRNYCTATKLYVDRIMTFTRRMYDEHRFMYNVNKGTLNAMKSVIIKTNDQKRLEILARKFHLLEGQDKLLDQQIRLNKEVDDGMHALSDVEQELENYDAGHK